jgi:hypothetical protein
MDLLTDIFNSDAFSVTSLTAAVNELPYVPGQAGKLGIFEESGIPTTTFVIERNKGVVNLIPNTPRGASRKPRGTQPPRTAHLHGPASAGRGFRSAPTPCATSAPSARTSCRASRKCATST